MKNLLEAFSSFYNKRNTKKHLNKNNLINKKISVHYRRDLDSLEEFINFK